LAERIPIDRRRVYATGLSNGGMMAHRLAAEAADLIAAIAPVAGGMVFPAITAARSVPVMHLHSVDDPRALYTGGLGPPFPMTKSHVFHPNIDQMIARWVKHDGCAAQPAVTERRADSDTRGHTATRYVYSNCRDGAEVSLWKLTGAGHVWPGGKQKFMERLLGPSTDIICDRKSLITKNTKNFLAAKRAEDSTVNDQSPSAGLVAAIPRGCPLRLMTTPTRFRLTFCESFDCSRRGTGRKPFGAAVGASA